MVEGINDLGILCIKVDHEGMRYQEEIRERLDIFISIKLMSLIKQYKIFLQRVVTYIKHKNESLLMANTLFMVLF